MEEMRDKYLGIRIGKPPQFIGVWTNGECRMALMAALRWLDELPLSLPERTEPPSVPPEGGREGEEDRDDG